MNSSLFRIDFTELIHHGLYERGFGKKYVCKLHECQCGVTSTSCGKQNTVLGNLNRRGLSNELFTFEKTVILSTMTEK